MSQDLYLQLDTARSQNSQVHSKKIAFQNSFSDIRACVDEDHVIRLKDSEYFFLEL